MVEASSLREVAGSDWDSPKKKNKWDTLHVMHQ